MYNPFQNQDNYSSQGSNPRLNYYQGSNANYQNNPQGNPAPPTFNQHHRASVDIGGFQLQPTGSYGNNIQGTYSPPPNNGYPNQNSNSNFQPSGQPQPMDFHPTNSVNLSRPPPLHPSLVSHTSQNAPNLIQPQHSGYYNNQPPPTKPLAPTETGFIQQVAAEGINNDLKIPPMRLSFITANDQSKFETLFRSQVQKGANAIEGPDCRKILMKSGLIPSQLAQIWTLSDTNRAGALLFPEFCLAMYLVNTTLKGNPIPYVLDKNIKTEVDAFIDAISVMIATEADSDDPMPTTNPFGSNATQRATSPPSQSISMSNPPVPSRLPSSQIPTQSQQHSGLQNLPPQISPNRPGISSPNRVHSSPNVQMGGQTLPGITSQQQTYQTMQGNINVTSQTSATNPQDMYFRPTGPAQPALIPNYKQQGPLNGSQQNTNLQPMQQSDLQQPQPQQPPQNIQPQPQQPPQNIQPQPSGPLSPFNFNIQNQTTGTLGSPQITGYIPSTTFGMPMQPTGGMMQPQRTGSMLQAQRTGSGQFNVPMQTQATGGGIIQPQLTGSASTILNPGYIKPQSTGSLNAMIQNQPMSLQSQPTGGYGIAPQGTGMMISNTTGMQQQGNLAPMKPLTAQKTGFGNNEIYNKSNFVAPVSNSKEDTISDQEKALYNKIFDTYDTSRSGYINSPTAVEIFRKSGLRREDLEHIWNLCDTNNNGQLERSEFIVGMHLVYQTLNGKPLPQRLSPNLIPKHTAILNNVRDQLMNTSSQNQNTNNLNINAPAYKNNDQDTSLPNFRNRNSSSSISISKTSPQDQKPTQSTGTQPVSTNNKLHDAIQNSLNAKIMTLQNAIKEKKRLLDVEQKKVSQYASNTQRKSENTARIEEVKRQLSNIQAIQIPANSSLPDNYCNRVENIIKNVPVLFTRINDIEESITATKLQLYHAKNPFSNNESDEIDRINAENQKNKQNIVEIQKSVSELSSLLLSSVTNERIGKNSGEFGRWEFGLDLEPQVRQYVSNVKHNDHIIRHNSSSTAPKVLITHPSTSNMNSSNSNISNSHNISSTLPQNTTTDDMDDEEKRLEEELARLQLQKRVEKEERIARLRKQVEEAKASASK
ncbi:hypothetical protein TBLA_0J01820 [Henningerozyma blattae CBS 6284]|uniref:Actin cytoskeleton-regulatory complex protein PAN1 n=1 Tax=Henningerozyma blattae (strain ATCC 34711 / CBS 6284 / DSM 70876 / NBRC 10599 / NRRL Y-10934 / UCD 77-7) TaxID=1071380 RepID=I2H9X4_HENB6|nr:hypothetical protein TBLA_0J01820 [Tetrapisispora blattae CBS 6284]CCH63176.1 hypothetical protein TBLA_0J01820 [Tetrapisispora blattae CBS 6284]